MKIQGRVDLYVFCKFVVHPVYLHVYTRSFDLSRSSADGATINALDFSKRSDQTTQTLTDDIAKC